MSVEETEQNTKAPEQSSFDEQTKNTEPEQCKAETPRITNDNVKTDPVRKVVNKKLSTMSKETKEGKKTEKEH